jgi:hypothetical protein
VPDSDESTFFVGNEGVVVTQRRFERDPGRLPLWMRCGYLLVE